MESLDPKGVAVSKWQKSQSKEDKRSVEAVKPKRPTTARERERVGGYDGDDDDDDDDGC